MSRARLLVPLVCVVAACSSGASVSTSAPRSSAPMVSDFSVAAADVTLHARAVGPAEAAETLITVHGGPGLSLEAMTAYERLVGPERRVVGYDQRGSGRSTSSSTGDFSLAAQVADLEALRIALRVDTVELLGESWGGGLAAAYAAAHPERVSALVLVGSIPLERAEVRAGQRRFLNHVQMLQAEGLIPDPVPSIANGSCMPAIEAELPAYVSDPRSHPPAPLGSCTGSTARAAYASLLADSTVEESARRLARYTGRALVVMGDDDAFGLEWLDLNVRLLAGASVDRFAVPSAGHLVMVDQPDLVLARIVSFLDG
ncbi:MAG: alpha/beta hydrolase [Actinomycetota bacterium]